MVAILSSVPDSTPASGPKSDTVSGQNIQGEDTHGPLEKNRPHRHPTPAPMDPPAGFHGKSAPAPLSGPPPESGRAPRTTPIARPPEGTGRDPANQLIASGLSNRGNKISGNRPCAASPAPSRETCAGRGQPGSSLAAQASGESGIVGHGSPVSGELTGKHRRQAYRCDRHGP